MTRQGIGLYSAHRDLFPLLRERCPGWSFIDRGEERDACRVAIIDSDAPELLDAPPRKSMVRILLFENAFIAHERRSGELCLSRHVFMAAPAAYRALAADLPATAVHASQLEPEVGYRTQTEEPMPMSERAPVARCLGRARVHARELSR